MQQGVSKMKFSCTYAFKEDKKDVFHDPIDRIKEDEIH
jgi:hypothetical protein